MATREPTKTDQTVGLIGILVILLFLILGVSWSIAHDTDSWDNDVRPGCYVHTVTDNRVWWDYTSNGNETKTLYCQETSSGK